MTTELFIFAIVGVLFVVVFILKPRITRDAPSSPADANVEQANAMLAMLNEIDRAILSNASFERVSELVFAHAHQYVPYAWLAITPLEKEAHPPTLLALADGKQSYISLHFDSALKSNLDEHPNGYLIEDLEQISALKPLHGLGATCMLLFPIFRDAELSAVMSFGFAQPSQIDAYTERVAGFFADRLGVSLTSVFRAKQLFYQEHYDLVTGLPNRRSCHQRLSLELSRAHRNQLKLAVLYISLDGFKKVNDVAGYTGGDAVLNQVAHRLREHLREPDLVSRFGSDEFVVVLTDVGNSINVGKVAEKILDLLAEPFAYEDFRFYITATIGISVYPSDSQSVESLLHQADTAMSRLKSKTPGQFIYYEEEMNSVMVERLNIERDLRQALNNDEIFLMYQPQLDLRTKKITGVEVLMRWRHPKRGVVSPLKFIDIAEESDLIELLGYFARKTACEQLVEWKKRGLLVPKIALNVSSKELKRAAFEADFNEMLQLTGVHPSSIELEITESLLVEQGEHLQTMLKRLRDDGVQIAIDDFGTGYSSLNYLAHLPFDVLKIDRAFVEAIGKPAETYEIVSVMIHIAHHFGKKVCAEGVENKAQWTFLKEHGCETIQGFMFSEPLSPEDFEKLYAKVEAESYVLH